MSMSGPEHYEAAEELLGIAKSGNYPEAHEPMLLAAAQVHATLALAAATALYPFMRANEDAVEEDWVAWLAVADTKG
jgi:hypothetical protein